MFQPWIGQELRRPKDRISGRRLLIIGESHYPSEKHLELIRKCVPKETAEIVQHFAIEKPYLFFSRILHLITENKFPTNEERLKFWHSVAFYNFIPTFMPRPSSGKRPRVADWRAGKNAFATAFDEVNPTHIIVCGLGLWWWVMDSLPGGEKMNRANRDFADIKSARALRIPHPSSRGISRYSYSQARPMVEQLFNDFVALPPPYAP